MDEIVGFEVMPEGFRVLIRKEDGSLLILTPGSSEVSDDNREKYVCAVGVSNGWDGERVLEI